MLAGERPVVVKLGGSFACSMHLRDWIEALAACGGRAVIVPGGGPFADVVRTAQSRIGFDDQAAHHMAVLAMEQYGRALAGCDGRLSPADTVDAIRRELGAGRVPVWMPTRMVLDEADIAPSWDVTSDSLAAWLASRIGARRLLLVKHGTSFPDQESAERLAATGVVDKAFPRYFRQSSLHAAILGPADHDRMSAAIRDNTAVGFAIA